MDRIRKGLFLGGEEAAQGFLQGTKHGITHVLSMLHLDNSREMEEMRQCMPRYAGDKNVKHLVATKMVPLADTSWENLLSRLEECLDFIDAGRNLQGGEVLVHCQMGVSRSASVVVAYLMRNERLSLDVALAEVKRYRPIASPNRGFLEQLRMFESMGYRVDKSCSLYKEFCKSKVEQLVEAHKAGYRICSVAAAAVDNNNTEEGKITCKTCTKQVAAPSNMVKHDVGCRSMFIQPMSGMDLALGPGLEAGKIFCAGCGARLGRFNWEGTQCNCGCKVSMAFQLFGDLVHQPIFSPKKLDPKCIPLAESIPQ